METEYKIKTPWFEGPLGLLLDLVEKRKLFINDLSLAEVTEDFLNYVKLLAESRSKAGEVSSFIVVAATLILIKSKSLLPNLDLTAEEEGNIHDLEERLRLYEQFRKLSMNVKSRFGKKIIFAPLEKKNGILIFLPDEQITKERMMNLVQSVLGSMPQKEKLPEVPLKKIVSIEEMIKKLTERIEKSVKINFRDFAKNGKSREEKIVVIVGFLAMLELVRRGILEVKQENNFSDILIEKAN